MRLRLHAFDLPLRHTFTISRESTDVQSTLIVELVEGEHHGYGESTTSSYYGFTIKNMAAALESVRPQLESQSLHDPVELWRELDPVLRANPFAQCALDLAAYDLWGKKLGQPVYRLWGLDTSAIRSPITRSESIRSTQMIAKMAEFPDWPIYKIKLGTPDDLSIVRGTSRRHRRGLPRGREWGLDSRGNRAQRKGPRVAQR